MFFNELLLINGSPTPKTRLKWEKISLGHRLYQIWNNHEMKGPFIALLRSLLCLLCVMVTSCQIDGTVSPELSQDNLPLVTRTIPTPIRESPHTVTASSAQNATQAGDWWKPSPDAPIHWHWQLSDTFVVPRDVLPNVTVYDIDGELTAAKTVAQLHALGPDVKVICYFDAGVYESYRSDASRFPPSVIGKPDVGWSDSYWLDIRQTSILLPIMQDRMQHWCKEKGFDAIEPDETEVWSNDSGFPITKAENNAYNQQIAALAHRLNLSVGLKGNTTEAPELWSYFDWTLNEQCWEFEECDLLNDSFIAHGKAVLNIEYNVDPNCIKANAWHMNAASRDLNLVGPTNPNYRYAPCIADTVNTWVAGLSNTVLLQFVVPQNEK